MEPNIQKLLEEKEPPNNVTELLGDLKRNLKFSRGKMQKHYSKWDNHLRVFRGERPKDESDINAALNDEPQKMVVPMQYTQVMTFVTFAYLLFKQNPTFFTMLTRKNADHMLVETGENFLERDLRHNQWSSQVVQHLLDIARMGVCASKTVWHTETMRVNVDVEAPLPIPVFGGPFSTLQSQTSVSTVKEVTKFEGNKVIPVSPYRLIPDMRLPLTRWKEGRFVADEQEYHIQILKEMEARGLLAGTQYVRKMVENDYKTSDRHTGNFAMVEETWAPNSQTKNDETDFMVLVCEGHFKLNPRKYGLGPEDYDCDYLVAIANDQRIIRIEKAEYMHGESIYDIAQFLPDVHAKLNHALTDSIDPLQDVITWLINSRVLSVRRGLETHAVVDPSVVDTAGIEGRQPIYYLRKGAPRVGIDKFFQQLKYVDPTTSHFQDADILMKVMQSVTGVNENAMGQYAPGRRSATENRAANAGAASRMMLHASIVWDDLYAPLGRKMHTNLRQGLSFETFLKVVGPTPPNSTMTVEQMYEAFCPPDISTLVGSEDFFAFDGTTSNERGYIAQSLQELVIALISNPEMIQLLNFDVNKLIDEIQFYRGVRNLNRFKLAPVPQPGPALPGQLPVGGVAGGPAQLSQNLPVPALPAGAAGGA